MMYLEVLSRRGTSFFCGMGCGGEMRHLVYFSVVEWVKNGQKLGVTKLLLSCYQVATRVVAELGWGEIGSLVYF